MKIIFFFINWPPKISGFPGKTEVEPKSIFSAAFNNIYLFIYLSFIYWPLEFGFVVNLRTILSYELLAAMPESFVNRSLTAIQISVWSNSSSRSLKAWFRCPHPHDVPDSSSSSISSKRLKSRCYFYDIFLTFSNKKKIPFQRINGRIILTRKKPKNKQTKKTLD